MTGLFAPILEKSEACSQKKSIVRAESTAVCQRHHGGKHGGKADRKARAEVASDANAGGLCVFASGAIRSHSDGGAQHFEVCTWFRASVKRAYFDVE